MIEKVTEELNQKLYQTNNIEGEKIVVFIDLLGFSDCVGVKENLEGAINKLHNYNTILSTQYNEQKIHPVSCYCKQLKELAESSYVTTFDYFLPASDSVFIASDKAKLDTFVKQLCSFLFRSYNLTSYLYANPDDESEATLQKGMKINYYGKTITTEDVSCPPCLFRGGMSIGECEPLQQIRVVKGNMTQDNCNLVGKAVVEAVDKEKLVSGPRIITTKKLFENCSNDIQKHYLRKLESEDIKEKYKDSKGELYELLWPVAAFIRENGISSEIGNLSEFVKGAYNLYHSKSNESENAKKHYKAFLELLYNSILIFWDNNEEAQETVTNYRKQYSVS